MAGWGKFPSIPFALIISDNLQTDGKDWEAHQILRDHPYPVGCLSWSLDDSIILTSAENTIKMWNTQVNDPFLLA